MQVQPTPKTDSQTAPKKAAGAADGQAFPNTLLNVLSLIPQPPPQGPEPPFLPPRTTRGAEEAAKVPTVTSQKLDSPHSTNQPTIQPLVAPDVTALTKTLPATGKTQVVAPTQKVETKVNPISIAKPNVEALKPDAQADPKLTQAPVKQEAPQVLPADPVAPITSVSASTEPVHAEPTKADTSAPTTHAVKQTSGSAKADTTTAVTDVASTAKTGSQSKGGGSFGSSSRQSKQDKPAEAPISAVATTTATKTISVKAPTGVTELQGLDRTALVKQVADKMQAIAASRSKEGVIVQLAPKALGTITVTLKTVGTGMDAHLSASNEQVRKALEQSRPDLAQAMGNRGYKLTTVTVSQETASSTSGNKQQQLPNQQRQQAPAQRAAVSTNDFDKTSTALAADRPSSANNAGVDLWI